MNSWELWPDCLDILRRQNTQAGFDAVYKNSTAYLGNTQLIIVAQSSMAQEWMERRLNGVICQTIKSVWPEFKNGGGDIGITYRWAGSPDLQADLAALNNAPVGEDLIFSYLSKKEASSQYFRRFWRPLLGPTLSELIRELRQRGYYGKEEEGPKEEIHVRLDTLAQTLGIGTTTLDRYLKRDRTGKFEREYLNLFIMGMEIIKRYNPDKGRKVNDHVMFKIKQVDPLIPEHEAIFSKHQNGV